MVTIGDVEKKSSLSTTYSLTYKSIEKTNKQTINQTNKQTVTGS